MKVQRHVYKIEKLVLFIFVKSNFPLGFEGKSKSYLDLWNNYCCLSTSIFHSYFGTLGICNQIFGRLLCLCFY